MGPYWGGQAEYLRVPWADFNVLKLPAGTKPLFGVPLMTGACRFGLTGLYELGTGGTVTELTSGWIGIPLVAFSVVSRGR